MRNFLQHSSHFDLAIILQVGHIFLPSIAWKNQVFYFPILKRFSSGREQSNQNLVDQRIQSGSTSTGRVASKIALVGAFQV